MTRPQSIPSRMLHQLGLELHTLRVPALGLVLMLGLYLHTRLTNDISSLVLITYTKLLGIAALIALLMIGSSIRRDAPSNTDTMSRSRPIGDWIIWISKLVAFTLVIIIPYLVGDLIANLGFNHTLSGWRAIVASSLLLSTLFVGTAAALLSLAANKQQAMIMVIAGILGAAIWFLVFDDLTTRLFDDTTNFNSQNLRTCAITICALILLGCALISWWLSAVKHRRALAGIILSLGLLQWPVTLHLWNLDWISQPPLAYTSASLTLEYNSRPSNDLKNGQSLWPRLHLAGLNKGEVATIIAFAPITSGHPWPSGPFATDYQPDASSDETWAKLRWLRNDHARSLLPHYPGADMMDINIHDSRQPLEQVYANANASDPTAPWRIRLAIHKMRSLGEWPLAETLVKKEIIHLHPGRRLEIGPRYVDSRSELIHSRVRNVHSRWESPQPFAPLQTIQGYEPPLNVFTVFRDASARRLSADHEVAAITIGGGINHNSIWMEERKISLGGVSLREPWDRYAMLGVTRDEWLQNTTFQVWYPEYLGTIDLEITAEQMRQLIPAAK